MDFGGEENSAIAETLKCLFQHFSAAFSAFCCLRVLLLKRWRKIEKGNFILIQNSSHVPLNKKVSFSRQLQFFVFLMNSQT